MYCKATQTAVKETCWGEPKRLGQPRVVRVEGNGVTKPSISTTWAAVQQRRRLVRFKPFTALLGDEIVLPRKLDQRAGIDDVGEGDPQDAERKGAFNDFLAGDQGHRASEKASVVDSGRSIVRPAGKWRDASVHGQIPLWRRTCSQGLTAPEKQCLRWRVRRVTG